MSIELQVKLNVTAPLAEILASAEGHLSGLPHDPIILAGAAMSASEILIAPAPWESRGVTISTGRVARVYLWSMHYPDVEEMMPNRGRSDMTEQERRAIEETAGWWAMIDAGVYRTRASFCLAALLACAIASRNGSSIQDDAGTLRGVEQVQPGALAAMFARWQDASSFEEFADAFCDEINFAPDWPRASEELAQGERS
jgi:hypothetical protein